MTKPTFPMPWLEMKDRGCPVCGKPFRLGMWDGKTLGKGSWQGIYCSSGFFSDRNNSGINEHFRCGIQNESLEIEQQTITYSKNGAKYKIAYYKSYVPQGINVEYSNLAHINIWPDGRWQYKFETDDHLDIDIYNHYEVIDMCRTLQVWL